MKGKEQGNMLSAISPMTLMWIVALVDSLIG